MQTHAEVHASIGTASATKFFKPMTAALTELQDSLATNLLTITEAWTRQDHITASAILDVMLHDLRIFASADVPFMISGYDAEVNFRKAATFVEAEQILAK